MSIEIKCIHMFASRNVVYKKRKRLKTGASVGFVPIKIKKLMYALEQNNACGMKPIHAPKN